MFVPAPHMLSSSILVAPRRLCVPSSPCITPGSASLSERSRKFVKRKKKAPQMTIKPGQYFMKMKCSGTVYSGEGGGGGGGGGAPNQWMQSSYHLEFFFSRPTFYKGVTGGWGSPGPHVTPRIRTEEERHEHKQEVVTPPTTSLFIVPKLFSALKISNLTENPPHSRRS